MLQKLLLSSAPKITSYAFKKMPIFQIVPLIVAINVNYTNFSAMNSFIFINN